MSRSGVLGLIPLLLFTGACRPSDVLEVRFPSQAVQGITSELKVFVFSDQTTCEKIDPRGLGPGDAQTRTGLVADFSESVDPEGELSFDGVPTGPSTVVIEAWGLPCADVGGTAEAPICNRLVPDGDPILRGYWCNDLLLSSSERVDLVAALESFALIGSTIAVPTNFPSNAVHYDDEDPLFVADGLLGRDAFTVQVLNHLAEAENQVKVRFEVVEGAGALSDPQPIETARDPAVQDDGLAATRLQADLFASTVDDGRIVVTAHAPGYEGSPVRFVARAVPNVRVALDRIPIAEGLVDLDVTDGDNHPLLVADLDGDGHTDVATVAGFSTHRLVLAYGDVAGGFSVHVSQTFRGQVRAMTTARLAPGRPAALVLSVADTAATLGDTPFGRTYIIDDPRLEVHDRIHERPTETDFTAPTPTVVRQESGSIIEKAAISLDARDIDADGVDEIALSRCSYVFATNANQSPFVHCNARLSDRTDSELALLRVAATDPPAFDVVATQLSEGNDGGYRGVRLIDVDQDGSLDLVSAASSIAVGFCGRAGMPQNGFGFNDARRFFTTVTFGQAWSLAEGRFDDDDFTDLLVTGAVRASSPDSGLKIVPGGPCEFSAGPNPIIVGPTTNSRALMVRTADMNGDGWTDAALLHRAERTLQIYLGGGALGLAAGPTVRLPFSSAAEMDLAVEGDAALIATVAPADNTLVVARIRPR